MIPNFKRKRPAGFKHRATPVSPKSDRNYFKDILLLLLGGGLTIAGNQFFHAQNKETEALYDYKKEILKMQYPYLNRIINFTRSYDLSSFSQVVRKSTVYKLHNAYTQEVKYDTVPIGYDTLNLIVPDFVIKEDDRNQFIEDLNEIYQNRDKVDAHVYEEFKDILRFIKFHPLPELSASKGESEWWTTEVVQAWDQLLKRLYTVTYYRLAQPYSDDIHISDTPTAEHILIDSAK